MWALEYEVDELQHKFADSIGKMDLDNLDVDFIEDMMLKAKPLQTVLNDIRNRQIVRKTPRYKTNTSKHKLSAFSSSSASKSI